MDDLKFYKFICPFCKIVNKIVICDGITEEIKRCIHNNASTTFDNKIMISFSVDPIDFSPLELKSGEARFTQFL